MYRRSPRLNVFTLSLSLSLSHTHSLCRLCLLHFLFSLAKLLSVFPDLESIEGLISQNKSRFQLFRIIFGFIFASSDNRLELFSSPTHQLNHTHTRTHTCALSRSLFLSLSPFITISQYDSQSLSFKHSGSLYQYTLTLLSNTQTLKQDSFLYN